MAVSLVKKAKKPKLPAAPAGIGVTSGMTHNPVASINPPPKPPTVKTPAAAAPAAAATPAAAVNPASQPGFKAPETTAGANARTRAQSTYDAALRTGRQGIVDAALRLGSPEIINALKADPNFAEYVAALDKGAGDPTSLLAQSQYNENRGLNDVDTSANAGNTFFSSKRVDDRANLDKGYQDANSGYLNDYHTNYNTLMGNMGTALGQYNQDLTDADTTDMNQYLATTPQPSATDAGTPAAAPTPAINPSAPVSNSPGAPTNQQVIDFLSNPNFGKDAEWNLGNATQPKAGYTHLQADGPRKGLSYNVVLKGGKRYKHYENDDWIPF